MSPKHSINFCPICGGGLCGIRICGVAAKDSIDIENQFAKTGSTQPHGLIVCDECEAIWLEPDVNTAHQYPNIEDAKCPICQEALWGPQSRWADATDVETLEWEYAVNPDLDANFDEGTT
ncbi:hypothetical protein Poly51_24170 [Rubripirellula tenax]|uniref:Uncharacterized protein n=1 Tax=Rubripirellula tenax TaxID=2528015 RepID=A0A5C6F8Q8_9BACT|nr:hypothetical protein [Rubripirellula tenax]TWU56506.1 hypothetical protein Poly51_24170 [Rubripirellula tenax]